MTAMSRTFGAAVASAALLVGGCAKNEPGNGKQVGPDSGLVLPPVLPDRSKRDLDITNEPASIKAFVISITPFLPANGGDVAFTQERAKAIFDAAFRDLGGVELPAKGRITLATLNSVISEKGFGMSFETRDSPTGPTLERISLYKITGQRRELQGNIFAPLLSLDKYPTVTIVSASSKVLFDANPSPLDVSPGRALIRDNKEALILVFPDEIKRQVEISKKSAFPANEKDLTEATAYNEAGHMILDKALAGRRIPEIEQLKLTLSPTNKITIPPFDHSQAHELTSDAFTFQGVKNSGGNFPAAVALLGLQSDEHHRATFALLNNVVMFGLYDYMQSATTGQEKTAREMMLRSLIVDKGGGKVSVNFSGVGREMEADPKFGDKMKDLITGVYCSVTNGLFEKAN